MKKYIFTLAILALGLTACNKEAENPQETPEQNPVAITQALMYHVTIPASMGADTKAVDFTANTATSKFLTSEPVYVYNKTKNAVACAYDNNIHYFGGTALYPDADGQSCTLSGDIAFYDPTDVMTNWTSATPIAVESTDKYTLLYQLNHSGFMTSACYYSFYDQTGTASGYDFALADDISLVDDGHGGLTIDGTAHFVNLGSIFRQQLSFKDKNSNTVTPILSKFTISSANDKTINSYRPFETNPANVYNYWPIEIVNPTISEESIYFALMFNDVNKDDALIFTAEDSERNIYTCTKSAPGSSFENGKYYHGDLAMTWLRQKPTPTVTRSDGGNVSQLTPVYNCYSIDNGSDPVDVQISGSSEEYKFELASGTVTLTGNGTASWVDPAVSPSSEFITCNGDLTINLASDYTIICPESNMGVYCDYPGNLKLKSTGGAHTLTVTTDGQNMGLYGENYWQASMLSNLAADGFVVTLADANPAQNTDGTYTYVYTVAPAYYAATAGDIGKVIGANGNIYDDAAAATAASTTAEAMIAFVGTIDGVCEHGLAISLTDVYEYNATFAEATGDVIISSWATYHPIAGGTWRLPSEADWQRMMWGYYAVDPAATDISTFRDNLVAAGGTALVDDAYYWTSTGVDAENAKTVLYDDPNAGIQSVTKAEYCHVRACFSF